jgi:uncharacterized protein
MKDEPFWSYEDLLLFLGAVVPSLALALLVVRVTPVARGGIQPIVFQCYFYVFMLAALYVLIRRYGRPFWRSLGWRFPRTAWWAIPLGPLLAVALSAVGAALRAPDVPTIQDLMTTRMSMVAVIVFGSLLGPLFEELVFRGFLLPLLARSIGAGLGVVCTAIPFALLHGPTFHWSWQSLLIVGLAGVVFGIVREATGSTGASAMVHIGYNSTLFAGFLLQR